MSLQVATPAIPQLSVDVDVTRGLKPADIANLDLSSVDALLQSAQAHLARLEEEGQTLTHYKKGRNTIAKKGVKDSIEALTAHRTLLLANKPVEEHAASLPEGPLAKRSAMDDGAEPQPSSKRARSDAQTEETQSRPMEVDTAVPSNNPSTTANTGDKTLSPNTSQLSTFGPSEGSQTPALSTDNAQIPALSVSNTQVPVPFAINAQVPVPFANNVQVPAPFAINAQVPALSANNAQVPVPFANNAQVLALSANNAQVPAPSASNVQVPVPFANNVQVPPVEVVTNDAQLSTDPIAVSNVQTPIDHSIVPNNAKTPIDTSSTSIAPEGAQTPLETSPNTISQNAPTSANNSSVPNDVQIPVNNAIDPSHSQTPVDNSIIPDDQVPAGTSSSVPLVQPAPNGVPASTTGPSETTSTSTSTSTSTRRKPKKSAANTTKRRAAGQKDNDVEVMEVDEAQNRSGTVEEEMQEVYDVDEGRTVVEPKKYVHMANNWNSLTPKQKAKVEDIGARDEKAYHKFNTPFSDSTRTWSLRHYAFMPELSIECKKVAAHIFIDKNGRTRCVAHGHTDGTTDDSTIKKTAPFRVTGTPFPPQPVTHGLTLAHLQREEVKPSEKGKERARANPLAPNPRFTLSHVLEFFPFAPDKKTRILHCGCALDGALYNLYLYKTLTIKSLYNGRVEPYGRRFSTRERLAIVTVLTGSGFSVDDLFTHDSQGNEIGQVGRLKRIIERLQVKVDKVAKEEYNKIKRDLDRKAAEAKKKFQSRWEDVHDGGSSDVADEDLGTQALFTTEFTDSSDDDDGSYRTGSEPASVAEEYEQGWDGETETDDSAMGEDDSDYCDEDAEGEIVSEEGSEGEDSLED